MAHAVLILAVETATDRVGCAIAGPDGVLAAVQATRGRQHCELLAAQIVTACDNAGVKPKDFTAVAVDVGPGLYTGLRVGVTTAAMMAHALSVGVVACSSLDVLAFPLRHSGRLVEAVLDARRKEVFHARYRCGHGRIERLTEPRVASPEQIASRAPAPSPQQAAASVATTAAASRPTAHSADDTPTAGPPADPVPTPRSAAPSADDTLLVGDGVLRYRALFDAAEGVELGDEGLARPSAEALALMALPKAACQELRSPHEITPCYLRRPDARPGWGEPPS